MSRNEWVTRCGAGRRPTGHSAEIAINEGRPDRLCHRQGSSAISDRAGHHPAPPRWQDPHIVPDRVSSAMPLHYDAVRTRWAGLTNVTCKSSQPDGTRQATDNSRCGQVAAQQHQWNLHCARHAHVSQIFAVQLLLRYIVERTHHREQIRSEPWCRTYGGRAQIATRTPSSTTRSDGMRKNSVAGTALRASTRKSQSRHHGIFGTIAGTSTSRPRK
jgi:hypothetical protein